MHPLEVPKMALTCRCRALLATILAAMLPLTLASSQTEIFMQNHPDTLPSFLIIGTAKGGTTDLFGQLTAPLVNQDPTRPDPPLPDTPIKEAGLLSRGGVDSYKLLPQRAQYMEYLKLLSHPCGNSIQRTLLTCMAANASKQFTLDATPTYSFSAVAPLHLRELSTVSKIIMMIREPVERAEVLYRHYVLSSGKWPDHSIDDVASIFFDSLSTDQSLQLALQRASKCSPADILCLSNSWRDMSGLDIMEFSEHKLFAGGLYPYALSTWRHHYFRPGRVLIVDSHAYFDRRLEVMEKVIRFLYGREMLPSERLLATSGKVSRKVAVPSLPKMSLSPHLRRRLTEFYDEHVTRSLFQMLSDLRAEGAWMIGFDSDPWSNYPGFAEFNVQKGISNGGR